MKKILTILILLGIFAVSREIHVEGSHEYSNSIILSGIILITAYLFALLIKKVKLPKLTGYMVLGMIIGPAGLNFLNNETLIELKFLENLALSFIAITAGGEFKYTRIKKYIKVVLTLLVGQIVFVFAGMLVLLTMFADYIPFFRDLEMNLKIGFAILLAGTAVSTSPATTMGIITELRSKGKLTDIVLSLTVLKSISLVLIFPLIIIWAKFYLIEGTVFNITVIGEIITQILGSVLFGVMIGFFIIWYLKTIKKKQSIFLLGITIIITEASSMFNVEILLTSIIAGIIVENFSEKGEQLIKSIEQSSLPFYILFFGFAGAGLHLDTIQSAFALTFLLIVMRTGLIYLGNLSGALIVKEDKRIKNLSWLGFIAQAGIALGLGIVIDNTFSGEIMARFKTVLLASVVINEFFGPIFLKYILVKSDEAQTKS